MDDEGIMYIYGCTHPPGKASAADVKVLCDDMTQDELDALDLTGVPITLDHPPVNIHVKDTPELVCGKILQMTRGEKGSKYVLGWISARTPAGAEAYKRLVNGELGLSLGHQYTERRYAVTKELHSRSFAPDHVSLCSKPRRDGCWIGAAGYRRPAAYLKQPAYLGGGDGGRALDVSSSATVATQQHPAPTATTTPTMSETLNAAPALAPNAGGQAPSAMDTSQAAGPIPADWSRERMHQDLMATAATMRAMQENEAKMAAEFAALQKQTEDLAKAKAQLEKERDEQRAKQQQLEQAKAQKYMRAIAEASRGLKKMNNLGGDGNGITEEGLQKALFANGYTQEGIQALEEFHMVACAAAERDQAVQQYEELRKQVFGLNSDPNKRLRMEQSATMLPSSMQPSHSAPSPSPSTSQHFESMFKRTPFGMKNMAGPVPTWTPPADQRKTAPAFKLDDIPGGYVPIGAPAKMGR